MAHEYRTVKPWQWDQPADVRLMARAEGYCMVRRKGCTPTIIDAKEWDNAPVATPDTGRGG